MGASGQSWNLSCQCIPQKTLYIINISLYSGNSSLVCLDKSLSKLNSENVTVASYFQCPIVVKYVPSCH